MKSPYLDHKNVVGLCRFSFNDETGVPILLTEYVENGSLLDFVRDDINNISYIRAIGFGLEAAMGMEYLAQKDIVHRDLAARNCLLSANLTLKICDFGLSRKTDEYYIGCQYYRQSNATHMPFRWVALESLENLCFCSKTDVWSFGVLLWEIFTRGLIPYRELSDDKELKAYLQRSYRCEMGVEKPLRLLRPPHVQEETWKVMESTWRKDQRYRPDFSNLRHSLQEQQKLYKGCSRNLTTLPVCNFVHQI